MSDQRVVVIGASAGGIDALIQIVKRLPHTFAAPILVVVHIPSHSKSLLAHIFSREQTLPAKQVEDGETLRNGMIYVAAPDKHLMIEREGTLRSVHGPRENRHRPAVDPLFRSAALAYGPGVIGVILSGALDDGTAGLIAVKKRGGIAIVQDPSDSLYPGMPTSAMEHVEVDYKLAATDIAGQLAELLRRAPALAVAGESPHDMEQEVMAAEGEEVENEERPGRPSVFSCPDCGGVLWQLDDVDLTRYRCRVGHAFAPEALAEAQEEQIETALWSAVKTLEESAQLSQRLATSERRRGHDWMAVRFQQREDDARERADVIRRFLTRERTADEPAEAAAID